MFLCGIFARNPASDPRISNIQESFTSPSETWENLGKTTETHNEAMI